MSETLLDFEKHMQAHALHAQFSCDKCPRYTLDFATFAGLTRHRPLLHYLLATACIRCIITALEHSIDPFIIANHFTARLTVSISSNPTCDVIRNGIAACAARNIRIGGRSSSIASMKLCAYYENRYSGSV